MKYVYFILVFILGIGLGRWSSTTSNGEHLKAAKSLEATLGPSVSQEHPSAQPNEVSKIAGQVSTNNEPTSTNASVEENPSLRRTDDKARDKEIRSLYSKLFEAREKNNTDEQNRLFAEMESLNPKHENVFQARAEFLEDDQNWDGALAVYKECAVANPDSVQCLRRIANIRSGTVDDKIRYGLECLEISKNDPLCLVDVAIAYRSRGEFSKAKEYFEKALSLPQKGEGYHREYILYQYAMTLKSLSMHPESRRALVESCRLKMKAACEELR